MGSINSKYQNKWASPSINQLDSTLAGHPEKMAGKVDGASSNQNSHPALVTDKPEITTDSLDIGW